MLSRRLQVFCHFDGIEHVHLSMAVPKLPQKGTGVLKFKPAIITLSRLHQLNSQIGYAVVVFRKAEDAKSRLIVNAFEDGPINLA